MSSPATVTRAVQSARSRFRGLFGGFRAAYLPILVTYFAFGASAITGIATLYFQKDVLKLTPAEVAEIGFWLGLPWSMKMVVGVSSDAYPIFGSRRLAYLLLGVACSVAGFAALAAAVDTKGGYLAAMLLVTIGFMIQDVVADALSVEVARNDEEVGQIQALGRMALLVGSISVGYASGVLAEHIGPHNTFAVAMSLPALVLLTLPWMRGEVRREATSARSGPLGHGTAGLVLAVGLGYAGLGVALNSLDVSYAQEIVLVVSVALISFLLRRVRVSAAVAIAAVVIFLFRATPGVGQGYSYWAIDRLGFDQRFLGLLAQVSSILSLVGLDSLPQDHRRAAGELHAVLGRNRQHRALLAEHRTFLWVARVARNQRPHLRVYRYHDFRAARTAHDGSDADPHRAQRAAWRRGHHVRHHGVVDESRAFGERTFLAVSQPGVRGNPAGLLESRDSDDRGGRDWSVAARHFAASAQIRTQQRLPPHEACPVLTGALLSTSVRSETRDSG